MIKLFNINKSYNRNKSNEIKAVNNTSLELPDKGLIALLGKSGCGKTTLLNVIGGLDSFDSGAVDINGAVFNKYDSNLWDALRSRKIGYIFQNYYLINDKTVAENLEISLKLAGLTDKAETDKRIDYALSLVGLLKYKKRRPNTLSGGQQQRVGIARAIVKGPSIIIADEPTGNLDSDNTFEVMDMLKSISRTCLVVLVTHEESIANFFADRIIRIKDGVIAEDVVNNSNESLNLVNNKAIYLQDLKYSKSYKQDNLSIEYHGDSEQNLVLNLVVKDGKLYVDAARSSMPVITVGEESEIKLLDSHYEDKKKSEHVSRELDMSTLSPVKSETSGSVVDTMGVFKRAAKSYFKTPLKKKLLSHIILFLIAAVISVELCFAATVMFFDESTYTEDKNILTHAEINKPIASEDVETLINNGNILLLEGTVYFEKINNLQLENQYYYYSQFNHDLANAYLYPISYYGSVNTINNSEVLLDVLTADAAMKTLNYVGIKDQSYLIGEKYKIKNIEYTIAGFVDSGYESAYVNDSEYEALVNAYSNTWYLSFTSKDKDALASSLTEMGYSYEDLYQNTLDSFYSAQVALLTAMLITLAVSALVLLGVSSHTIKASFINRIKEIGTLRCIGVKKSELLKEFLFESVFVLLFSSLIGTIFTGLILKALEPALVVSMGYFNNNFFVFALAFLVVSAVSIGLTVSIVMNKLRATPAELMAQYDI